MIKKFALFGFKYMVVHIVTYFIVGALAYQLITKEFYQGSEAVFKVFMRTESEPLLWKHVMIWQLPGQVLRGLLMGLALFPFYELLTSWKYWKRVLVIFGVYFIFSHLAAAGPTTSNIEGLIYLRPDIICPRVFIATQPEIILQGLTMAMAISWWMLPKLERIQKSKTNDASI